MASACASASRSLRSTGATLTRLDCSNGDEGLHYAFIGVLVDFVSVGGQPSVNIVIEPVFTESIAV